MGLAASQARLLSLTARQHSVEGRAQYLQAQKLRLANESDKVYDKYISALDATSLQTRAYDSKGKVHWIDGSFNNLLRYDADEKDLGGVYYVQDINDGNLYMPEKVNSAYEKSGGDLFQFLDNLNIKYEKNAHKNDYIEALNLVNGYKNLGYDNIPYTDEEISKYSELSNNVSNPEKSNTYNTANALSTLVGNSKNSTNYVFYPYDEVQYEIMINQLKGLQNTSYYTGTTKTIIDYCINFDIPEIFNNTSDTSVLTAHNGTPTKTLYISYDRAKEEAKENSDDIQQIDNLMKYKMLLNGGIWEKTDNNGVSIVSTGEIYNEDIKTTLNNYVGTNNPNIGEALIKIAEAIKQTEYNTSKSEAENELETYLKSINTTQSAIESAILNNKTYLNAVADLNTKDQSTYTGYDDSVLGQYYEDMFNAIQAAGGCKTISTTNGKSSTWVNNMIKNAQVVLATYDRNNQELDNVTASSNVGLREVSNDTAITEADSEYEAALEAINDKERKYDTKLRQLESERNAIKTEIDSLKQIENDNISATFKLFS